MKAQRVSRGIALVFFKNFVQDGVSSQLQTRALIPRMKGEGVGWDAVPIVQEVA